VRFEGTLIALPRLSGVKPLKGDTMNKTLTPIALGLAVLGLAACGDRTNTANEADTQAMDAAPAATDAEAARDAAATTSARSGASGAASASGSASAPSSQVTSAPMDLQPADTTVDRPSGQTPVPARGPQEPEGATPDPRNYQ
jgi:hypothetical protein